jgi:hypothetical protein
MRRQIGLLSIVGFFGLLAAAADAQTLSSSTAAAPFDGTYRFVSSAKVNQTYSTRGGQMGRCPDRMPGPLTIAQGQARYTSATGRQFDGTVGSQGDFAMRLAEPNVSEMHVSGRIDGTGRIHARQRGNSCSYDFVWQKQST